MAFTKDHSSLIANCIKCIFWGLIINREGSSKRKTNGFLLVCIGLCSIGLSLSYMSSLEGMVEEADTICCYSSWADWISFGSVGPAGLSQCCPDRWYTTFPDSLRIAIAWSPEYQLGDRLVRCGQAKCCCIYKGKWNWVIRSYNFKNLWAIQIFLVPTFQNDQKWVWAFCSSSLDLSNVNILFRFIFIKLNIFLYFI